MWVEVGRCEDMGLKMSEKSLSRIFEILLRLDMGL
jgi:hypothetical protein